MHIVIMIRLEIERLTPVNCKQIVMQFLQQEHPISQLIQLIIVIMYYLLHFFFALLCCGFRIGLLRSAIDVDER